MHWQSGQGAAAGPAIERADALVNQERAMVALAKAALDGFDTSGDAVQPRTANQDRLLFTGRPFLVAVPIASLG